MVVSFCWPLAACLKVDGDVYLSIIESSSGENGQMKRHFLKYSAADEVVYNFIHCDVVSLLEGRGRYCGC